MKKTNFTKIMTLCLMLCGLFGTTKVQAQCPAGQTQVNVAMSNETFDGENGWILWDATAGVSLACANSALNQWVDGTSVDACAIDGNTIELYTYESFGDGWQGGIVTVTTNEDGSANGCNAQNLFLGEWADATAGGYPDDNDMTNGTGDGGINCNDPFDTGANTAPDSGPIVASLSFTVQCIACMVDAPADILAAPSEAGICGADITLALATVTADCGAGATITNDYNGGGADASGVYPVGTTIVTYETTDPNGSPVTATTTITVVDVEGPELSCPSTTSVGLDGGECNSAYFFEVGATDNCPQDAFTLNGPCPPVATGGGSALACNVGPNSIIQIIDGTNPTDSLTQVCFEQETFGTTTTVTVNVYCYDGVNVPFDDGAGTFTPFATETFTLSAADNGTVVCLDFAAAVELPAGCTSVAVEFFNAFGRSVNTPATCAGAAADGNQSFIVAPACGLNTAGLFSGIGFALDASFNASFLPAALEAIPSPTAPSGFNAFVSGDLLPIGTHCFQYEATDAAGNVSTCDWCVNVIEYSGPTANLACNANINVSVDENCEAIITADMVLEGGQFGCYENFNVTVSGLSPASAIVGNGTNSVIIKASQLDGWNGMSGAFEVSVSDPSDANNSCWNGGWMLEDKLAPTIECGDDVTISCLTDSAPGGATSTGTASGASADALNWADGDTGLIGTLDVDVAGIPAGASVDDVNVSLALDHSWVGDLTINLVSPSGASVTLVDGNCGINDNINATFDSEASNPISCAAGATAGPHEDCPGDYVGFATINNSVQPVGDLSTLYSEGNGTWTLEVTDNVGGDAGCLDAGNFSIDVAWTLQGTGAPTVVENCGQYELTHSDDVQNFNCTLGGPYVQVITRTWNVVDEKGNSASCVQTINVTPSTLADLTIPSNYDNADLPALDCSNANTDPSNTGSPAGGCENINSSYDDITFDENCEGTYTILRQWTIMDWCTGDIIEHNQTIKVMDSTAPTFAGIADLNESTTTNSCEANVALPAPVVSDDCSSNPTYTASASAGNLLPAAGGYVLYGLPIGTHTVTYEATDDCGNASSISFDITVTDEIVPVTVCETYHVVSLTTNEPTLVYANTFDDGSYDNCEIESMEVRRMTPPTPCIDFDWTTNGPGIDELPNGIVNQRDRGMTFWYPAVPFACCDVGGEHLVEFRVTDISGNSNTCMVTVEVDDKLDPVITCPANVTYDCSEYINESSDIAIDGLNQDGIGSPAYYVALNGPGNADNDTTYVGHYAAAFDNCEAVVYIRDAGTINNCGITQPFINRFFTAVDGGGRTDVCVQRLTVVNNNPYTGPLSFPTDRTLNDCDALGDPAQTGEPNISNDNTCSIVSVGYSDLELTVTDGACKKIKRTWTVHEECSGNTWTDDQTITIANSSAPVFDACVSPDDFCINSSTNGNCLATVSLSVNATDDCTADADINYTYWIDAFNDGTQDIGGSSSSFFSSQIPAGVHSISWTAEDACGNISTCQYLFTVKDCDGPTVYADGISVDLAQADEGDVWASDLDQGSFDNCSDICLMTIGVPSAGPGATAPPTASNYVFDCQDIEDYGSSIPVDLWVKDCADNWSYTTVTVLVTDNSNVCGPNVGASIAGAIETETGAGVNNVTVNLSSNAPGVMPTMTTNTDGLYTFGNLELDYNYTVTPDMDLDPLNGVSTYDLVLISKHILQTQFLDSPYKMIAADVNMNGSITTLDMVELRKLILFIETEFPVESSTWRFVEAGHQFNPPTNPWATVFPEETFVNGLTANLIADYVAIKKGDVNGSAVTGFAGDADSRSFNGELIFNVENRELVAGNTYTVDFASNEFSNIMGYQFSLGFDMNAIEVLDVQAGELAGMSNGNFGMSRMNEGVITTSWNDSEATTLVDDQSVFSVTFRATANTTLSEVFTVNSRLTAAEAYNADLDLMNVAIEYTDNNNEIAAEFNLLQNTPNPFKGQTVIGFTLPQAATATLSVYDLSGKVIRTVSNDFAKGYNEVTLDRSELNATGVLYYQLETADYTATKKMIILE